MRSRRKALKPPFSCFPVSRRDRDQTKTIRIATRTACSVCSVCLAVANSNSRYVAIFNRPELLESITCVCRAGRPIGRGGVNTPRHWTVESARAASGGNVTGEYIDLGDGTRRRSSSGRTDGRPRPGRARAGSDITRPVVAATAVAGRVQVERDGRTGPRGNTRSLSRTHTLR